ncbi:adenosine receptor A3-like [Montipora foliosa]|uniref:adenosine receptor A3-like n=1 Tax=Montipora foliosa TaxID=591990 RepID=UPI0035F1EDF8
MNDTNLAPVDPSFYLNTQLATAICLLFLSPITIISNVLLLFTLFRDPLKCFRNPATYFVVALALVDISTGILVEPFYVMNRVVQFITWSLVLREPYKTLFRFGSMFSYVVLNASFLLVLGLILTQYIAITFPHRYRSIVTTSRVLVFICTACVYFSGFILLQFAGVSIQTLFRMDLHLHSTLITVLLISFSCMLLRSLRKFAKTSMQLGVGAQNSLSMDARGNVRLTRTQRINEKQFTIVALLLSGIFIVCALLHITSFHITLYAKIETPQESLDLDAVVTIGDEMMFLKVALDAFIYAWRLPKYRRSLKIIMGYESTRVDPYIGDARTVENSTFQQPQPKSSTASV